MVIAVGLLLGCSVALHVLVVLLFMAFCFDLTMRGTFECTTDLDSGVLLMVCLLLGLILVCCLVLCCGWFVLLFGIWFVV